VVDYAYSEGNNKQLVVGERVDTRVMPAKMAKESGYKIKEGVDYLVQHLIKTGNRDISGMDFRWIQEQNIQAQSHPAEMITIERREWGNFYGRLVAVKDNGKVIATDEKAWQVVQERIEQALDVFEEIEYLQKKEIGTINYRLEKLRLEKKSLELKGQWNAKTRRQQDEEKVGLDEKYQKYQLQLEKLYKTLRRDSLVAKESGGAELEIPLEKVVRIVRPNSMTVLQKTAHYFEKFVEFVTEDPREANTEGGIFPAIFGTVMMVMLMAVIVTPFGVIAAVYLREYAKQGFTTRLIRIAVNNLAGVPSIVYGVFGLGFFVYILGGNIDELFYPEAAPAPVFGTPGLLWASLTLALLTLPVVIVSTEEGLSRIPKSIREGSLALGATKVETLWRTVLPMASPAMMTGLILAVARAAGEVAPLMLVGVVKLAPTLPLDGNFPFLHLD
jgi:phosphate transport system permease protein